MIANQKALKVCIIGSPVSHSLSPLLHNYWLKKYKISGEYVSSEVKPDAVEAHLLNLPKHGFIGANITIPHKRAAIKVCSEISDTARKVGAVNTLITAPGGKLIGDNTDSYGFIKNLKNAYKRWNPSQTKALVLGAGGASRSVCYGLLKEGVREIYILNRNRTNAENLKTDINDSLIVKSWKDRNLLLNCATLVVNTTSLGMTGMQDLKISLENLSEKAIVYDIVYTPLNTSFLDAARQRGNLTINGLGMFLYQAAKSFSLWFGIEPDVDERAKQIVLERGF
ncbi:MAG: shikimate dehydrogenase [Rhodospirillaceae bacterium]|nr:shikimate dehydrogenase [Rhodospirillaceae bacterium]